MTWNNDYDDDDDEDDDDEDDDDGEDDDDDDDLLDGQTRRSPGGDGPVRDDSSKQRVDCVGEVGRRADVTWSSSSAWSSCF